MTDNEFYDMLNDYYETGNYLTEEQEGMLERNGRLDEWNELIFKCKGCGFWMSRLEDESKVEKDTCNRGCED